MSRCSAAALALTLAALATLAAPATRAADDTDARADHIRANYTKFEHRIPMRDGARLFTAVYVPNDRTKTYPILLVRSPYGSGPYGADRYRQRLGPTAEFERKGCVFVFQDVRGRYLSEGTFVNMRPHVPDKQGPDVVDESSDTYDTIEWLLAHVEGHNGKVGQWGNSYPGFYTSAGMIDSHPALVASLPSAPIADWWFDDMHRHGAFNLQLSFTFFASFGQPRPEPTTERAERFDFGTPDAYQFFLDLGPLSNADARHLKGEIEFWNDIVAHPNYDGFWQSRNILPHLRNVDSAVLVVGGWYDTEDLYGPLRTYGSAREKNPDADVRLVMGPWAHGQWLRGAGRSLGDEDFGFDTGAWFREHVLEPWFAHHLLGEDAPDLPGALVFETGADRWRRFDAWPPAGARPRALYFREEGALSFDPPAALAEGDPGFDEFPSDPAKPVPYTMEISARWSRDFMTEDQRFAARRPDVLAYVTDPLEEDLTVAGPLDARLRVSTTGTDADWVVKLIDVWPDEIPGHEPSSGEPDRGGQQTLIRGEEFRGRFRESYEQPVPFVPGEVADVEFRINDVLHTFRRGHRIMIQVQSTWFPFIDRNPRTFVPNIFEAEETDFRKALHRVHRSETRPSHVVVPILE
jgi:putative CocE/NonD family hydrolase